MEENKEIINAESENAIASESNTNTSNEKENNVTKPVNKRSDESTIPSEYKPISMWGYFGYEVLFSIPLIGLIMLVVFSLGGTKNQNLKNFARSKFCILIVLLALIGLACLIIGVDAVLKELPNVKSWKY